MKLNSFKFQDGKVFWLPEYPEKTISYCSGKPYCCEGRRCDVLQHDDAVAKSLASAIEVAPEDMEGVKHYCFMQRQEASILSASHLWQPEKDKVYSAECEMEIVSQVLIQKTWHQTTKENYDKWSSNGTEPHYRQVARLKPKDEIPAANSHDMKEELK